MAEAKPVTIRIPPDMLAGAQRAVERIPGVEANQSLLIRAGLLLAARVPAAWLADAIDQARRERGWAGKAADDNR